MPAKRLSGEAVLKTSDGKRRIDGLSLTLGANTITGDLGLDRAFVPEGALAFTLPDIAPLAALAFERAAGEVKGSRSLWLDRWCPAAFDRRRHCVDRAR